MRVGILLGGFASGAAGLVGVVASGAEPLSGSPQWSVGLMLVGVLLLLACPLLLSVGVITPGGELA
jgi:type IV secretory pathway VirB2 component (pilin)